MLNDIWNYIGNDFFFIVEVYMFESEMLVRIVNEFLLLLVLLLVCFKILFILDRMELWSSILRVWIIDFFL